MLFFLLICLIVAVVFFSNQEDKIYKECEKLKDETLKLATILAHMENSYKTSTFTVSVFSELVEKWAKTINSFANNVMTNGSVSDKAWDSVTLFDSVCVQCKNMIKKYCNINDGSKISVSFVSYKEDRNGEKWVHMISHSKSRIYKTNGM